MHLDLLHDYHGKDPDCTCIRGKQLSGIRINRENPCRYHTTIDPLLEVDQIRRIRTLDVQVTIFDHTAGVPNQYFKDTLDDSKIFALPLPTLESLSFSVDHDLPTDTRLELPKGLFCLESSPPPNLRHLALHGCYGGPIRAVCNLTPFELTGGWSGDYPIVLDRFTFLPFISGNRSLVSLSLSLQVPKPRKVVTDYSRETPRTQVPPAAGYPRRIARFFRPHRSSGLQDIFLTSDLGSERHSRSLYSTTHRSSPHKFDNKRNHC